MNTEITPLEWLHYYERIVRESHQTFRPKGLEVIKTALKRLEKIDKSSLTDEEVIYLHNNIKNIHREENKKLKALEIIKNKSQIIDFTALAITNNYKDYIQWFRSKELTNKLTKEEFELLKEVLK